MGHIWPDDQWEFLQNYSDQNAKVTMLNLLLYREFADYSENPDEIPCSGEEAFVRYVNLAGPCVESCGGRVVFYGKAEETIIGPVKERWDLVVLVEYPSIKAFLEMINSDKYQAVAYHRTAALKDSRLIPIIS